MVRKPNKTMIGLFLLLGSAVFVFILGRLCQTRFLS